MEKLDIHTGSHHSSILLGESVLNLHRYLPHQRVIVITDTMVDRLYGDKYESFRRIVIQPGEKHKALASVEQVIAQLVELQADRSTFILGVGGGIVCDLAGFVASIYMRGLPFGFVSTTLLSQVDASVGGKNGVNFQSFKNMVGVFRQPEFVLCDYTLMRTLDPAEYKAGLAEVIKAAAIKDATLFDYISNSVEAIFQQDPDTLHRLVKGAVSIKAAIVQADELEKGERKILNFGHTFGHAIEKLTGIIHGEAVSIGMVMASVMSARLGFLKKEQAAELADLLKRCGLPVNIPVPAAQLLDAMRKDKKREDDRIHFVLLDRIGLARIHPVSLKEIETLIHDLYLPV